MLSGVLGSRIVVVGPPGAGKSTFSRQLADRLGVDCVERDGLGVLGSDGYRAAVAEMVARPGWVFDGFPYFCDALVYAAADAVVALRYPRALVLRRVLERSVWLLSSPAGGHRRASVRAWFRSDHAVRVAVLRWRARIAEIDGLSARPELAGKDVVVLGSPAEAARLLAGEAARMDP